MRCLHRTLALRAPLWSRGLTAAVVAVLTIGEMSSALAEGGSIGGAIGGSSGGSAGGKIGGGSGGSAGGGSGGSSGGSIGGKIAPEPSTGEPHREAGQPGERAGRRESARRSRRAARYEPARRDDSGGGGSEKRGGHGNFDGTWSYRTSSSCGVNGSGTMHITRGRFYARAAYGYTSGSVSPSGAYHAVGRYSGMTQVTTGRLSGSSGGGSFHQSTGCSGTWTASR